MNLHSCMLEARTSKTKFHAGKILKILKMEESNGVEQKISKSDKR